MGLAGIPGRDGAPGRDGFPGQKGEVGRTPPQGQKGESGPPGMCLDGQCEIRKKFSMKGLKFPYLYI